MSMFCPLHINLIESEWVWNTFTIRIQKLWWNILPTLSTPVFMATMTPRVIIRCDSHRVTFSESLTPHALRDRATRAVFTFRHDTCSWCFISFAKKFSKPNITVVHKDEHKHMLLCQQFQAQTAEAVRPIHRKLRPKTCAAAFNLHCLAYEYTWTQ